MNVEDEEWVAHSLLDYERKRCVSKVLSFNCSKAVPKGNNYVSDIYRINMKVVLYSGEVVNRSFIYKAMPETRERKKFVREYKFDKKEAMLFNDILPEIEKLRREKEHGVERLSPVCYGIRKDLKGYLLEDLNELGFKMADRNQLLDFDHAKLLMKAHAQFHASSVVLIERGDVSPNDFGDFYFRDNKKMMEPLISPMIKCLGRHIEEHWGSEWTHYGQRIGEFSKTAFSQYIECGQKNDSNFNALLHGDCWLANMMFRYNTEGVPTNIRILDFQMCHYNSVVLDLQFFIHSSLTAETYKRKEELLSLYFENLTSALDLYGYSGVKPTFEQILDSFNKANAYGLVTAFTFVPCIMQPQEVFPDDLEEWAQEFENTKQLKPPKFESKILCDLLQEAIKYGCSVGIL